MLLLFQLVTLIIVSWTTKGINADEIKNKTKRTLSHELYNYGETKPFYVYSDNLGSQTTSRELPNLSSGSKSVALVNSPQVFKVYDQQINPKVVSQPQQVFYEYQPLSTNTPGPNPQVRHFIQPFNNFNQDLPNQNVQIQDYKEQIPPPTNGHNFAPSETIVFPVQQRQNPAIINGNNGQPYSNIRFNSVHNTQTAPRKFVYVNGKLIYDPNHNPHLPLNINQPQPNPLLAPKQHLQYYQQPRSEKPPIINYVNRNHSPRLNLNTPTNIPYTRFAPTQKKQHQSITSTLKVPHKHDDQTDQEINEKDAPAKENDEIEEDSEEKSNDQEEDFEEHDQNPIFNKYSFDEYEESDHQDYKNHKEDDDEDEEDNKRGSTKHVMTKKYPRKHPKAGKNLREYYRYNDSDSKYDHPEVKSTHKNSKRPKMVYKSVKYSKEVNSKPKFDLIEGRYSENVPVTHKRNKVFKEKWYITKTDENLEAK